MCCIVGFLGKSFVREDVEKSLSKMKERGPDGYRVQQIPIGYLGFARLSIMGLSEKGMQPFNYKGVVSVCNGEIYGYRKIKRHLQEKGYTFNSESDCEILIPLYKEYGLSMSERLDSEFACIIYDENKNKIIAARDPIGIRPLYYGFLKNGEIAFASEAKGLEGMVEKIQPFPPGHYWCDGKFTCYSKIYKAEKYCYDELDLVCQNIKNKLIIGVEKRLDSDAPLGFLLSGGLDSSLVCSIASRACKTPIKTFAIGMEKDAIDLKYARQVADFLGTEHTEVIMTKEEVIDALEKVIYILATYDITTIRASIGMYLVSKYIHENTDIKVLLTGEISDELFGYKYTDYAPSAEEFQKESEKRVKELHYYDVLRADRCLASNSLEARVPFGDLDFVKYVISIDPNKKINVYNKGKYLLRKAFSEDNFLPEEILWREKAAFSDAVGHSMVDDLKEYAQNKYTDIYFEERRKKYSFSQPFTKESLLYREIFEKFYPNQEQMIPNFWMPNQEWEGCKVNDPSARVLKNYGDSGK